MKTSILIPALIFSLFLSAFASGKSTTGTGMTGDMAVVRTPAGSIPVRLAPVAYKSVDGTEAAAVLAIAVSKLAPVTPAEADFEETGETLACDARSLAPVIDVMPEFEEVYFEVRMVRSGLSPMAPAFADFTE